MPKNTFLHIEVFTLIFSWFIQACLAQSPNDLFANRIVLAGTNVTVDGSNVAADWGLEAGEPAVDLWGAPLQCTVWYSWTAPQDGRLVLADHSDSAFCLNLRVLAYKGAALSSLTLMRPDDTGKVTVASGDIVHIQVASAYYFYAPPCPGAFKIGLSLEPVLPQNLSVDQVQNVSDSVVRMQGLKGVSLGQTFRAGMSGELHHILLAYRYGTGSPACPVSLEVVEVVDGLPASRVLGRSVVREILGALEEFVILDPPVYLEAGVRYALVLSTCSTVDYDFRTSMYNSYGEGTLFQRTGNAAWEPAYLFGPPSPSMDLVFVTYMIPGIPPVRIDAPRGDSSFQVGDPVTISAIPGPDAPPPLTIQFFAGTELIGEASEPPFTVIWTASQAGEFDLTAVLADQSGLKFTSDPVPVTVKLSKPANDDFVNRSPVAGDYAVVSFSTSNAGVQPGEPRPFPSSMGQTLWWSWTAPRSGNVSVDVLEPTRGNAGLAVYMGSALEALQSVAHGVGHGTFHATAGFQYSIAVDGLADPLVGATLVLAQSDVELSNPTADAAFRAPAAVQVTASRTGTSRTLDRVEFYSNDTLVGTVKVAPFQLTTSIAASGYYRLRARSYDTLGVATDSASVSIVVHPQNDDFENAITIGGMAVTITTSNLGATMQRQPQLPPLPPLPGEPTYADNQGGHSIWYKWTAPEDGFCTISGSGEGFGLLLGTYIGTSVSALSLVAVNALNGGGPLFFYVWAGTTYCISIDGGMGEEGNLVWNLQLQPRNDNFTSRTLIPGSSYEVLTSQRGASLETGESFAPTEATSSIWWCWKAPISGPVLVSTSSALTDSRIAVFTGAALGSLSAVNSSSAWGKGDSVSFIATEGTTYQIVVYGRLNQVGDFTFSLGTRGIHLSNPLDGSVFASPAGLQLRAQTDDLGVPVVAVEFYANDQLLGATNQAPYHLDWNDIPPGTYKLVGRSIGEHGLISSSPPVTILVSGNSVPDTPRIFSGEFGNCSYVVNALGELSGFGNVGNQFGLSSADNLTYPQPTSSPAGIAKWTLIAAGSQVTWALSDAGELYRSGSQKIAFPVGVSRWIDLAVGYSVALIVGDNGRIYQNGQTLSEFAVQGIPWSRVAISGSIVVTLAKDGRAFEHGTGVYGTPQSALIPFPAGVSEWVRLGASFRQVILQGQNQELYRFPGNEGFVTGAAPTLVQRPTGVDQWISFSAGGYHILALGSSGQLYSWGRNWEGQLGIGSGGADIDPPTAVLAPSGVSAWKAIAAGYMHSLAIGADCSLYAWGDNTYGQLGLGLTLGQNRPLRVSNLRALCGAPIVVAEGEAIPLTDGSVRVQFKSDLNRSYLVQYTEDMVAWKTAWPGLTGTGGTLEWIDDGPPKTEAHPASQERRLYRLVYAP